MTIPKISQWATVVTGETPNGLRYANVIGVYSTKREASNAAARVRREPDHDHFVKHYRVVVHVRPIYGKTESHVGGAQ